MPKIEMKPTPADTLNGVPVMTLSEANFGLLPAALSTRIGAQTQQPLAIVVIGGALAIMILTRILQPVLIYLCHWRLRLDDQNRARLTQPIDLDAV